MANEILVRVKGELLDDNDPYTHDLGTEKDTEFLTANSEEGSATVVGGLWIKETGTSAPIIGLRVRGKIILGFRNLHRDSKAPDFVLFDNDNGAMAEIGCLWICNTSPDGKRSKQDEKLSIKLFDEYLVGVRPAPEMQLKGGVLVEKAPRRKDPMFLILAIPDQPTGSLSLPNNLAQIDLSRLLDNDGRYHDFTG